MDRDYGIPRVCAECGEDLVPPFCEHIKGALNEYKDAQVIWLGQNQDGQTTYQARRTGGVR